MTPLLTATLPFLDDVAKPEDMRPGAWAFVIVSGLLIITVLLWFSLRKQLGRIEVPYEDEKPAENEASSSENGAGDGVGSD